MLKIGLTGGIGSGKSAVAGRFARLGAVVIDADRLAREVVEPGTPGLRDVVDAFGPGVLTADGSLDRAAVAARVFADEAARRTLEGIIHPRVRARTAELTAAAPPDAIVVNDVPLLVEAGLAAAYHLVVVVSTSERIRVERLVRDRGMSPEEAYARIRAQVGDERRRAAADVWLDNDGPRERLAAAVGALWRDRLVPFEANVRAGRRAPRTRRPVLADSDPTWPAQAQRLIDRLAGALGGRAVRVDHIGSTSVPGLAAKDLIDLQVVVADPEDSAGAAADARAAGLVPLAGPLYDLDGYGGKHGKEVAVDADPGRPVNVHVRPAGSPAWRDALLFRDWLRADADARVRYEALKRRLAAHHVHDVDSYSADKQPWIADGLVRARAWATGAGWSPDRGTTPHPR